MIRSLWSFWGLVAALSTFGAVFAVGAERQRAALLAATAPIQEGETLTFSQAIDGDTVLLATEGGERVTVRLVGIKAFDRDGKDAVSGFGQSSMDALARALTNNPIRAELFDPPLDSRGRTLATLYVNDADVGLGLVREGLVLVYTAHPFPAVGAYLEEQAHAQQARRGVWGNAEAAERAFALAREWRARRK